MSAGPDMTGPWVAMPLAEAGALLERAEQGEREAERWRGAWERVCKDRDVLREVLQAEENAHGRAQDELTLGRELARDYLACTYAHAKGTAEDKARYQLETWATRAFPYRPDPSS